MHFVWRLLMVGLAPSVLFAGEALPRSVLYLDENDPGLPFAHGISAAFAAALDTGSAGLVADPDRTGSAAAQLALRVLNGESASNIPAVTDNFVSPVFDWRKLQRWNVSEERLPPGSDVLFRQPGLWEQYKW
jgi:hypothetical protein